MRFLVFILVSACSVNSTIPQKFYYSPIAGTSKELKIEEQQGTQEDAEGLVAVEEDEYDGEEGEQDISGATQSHPNLYTSDISDESLLDLFLNNPKKLDSVSLGIVNCGLLLNAVQFPSGKGWVVVNPNQAWATSETVAYLKKVVERMLARYPNGAPLRINHISNLGGGWMPPHKSHQNGRDVDLGFYYKGEKPRSVSQINKNIDIAKNWELVRSIITETDVQFILVDKKVIKLLHEYALSAGENPQWLESIFAAGDNSMVRHAKKHKDHFHVRFYNPRAQELGRRLVPFLPMKAETNVVLYRVKRFDSLVKLAKKYRVSPREILSANRFIRKKLRVGSVLKIPLRDKGLSQFEFSPVLIVPPRLLPPELAPVASLGAGVPKDVLKYTQ